MLLEQQTFSSHFGSVFVVGKFKGKCKGKKIKSNSTRKEKIKENKENI